MRVFFARVLNTLRLVFTPEPNDPLPHVRSTPHAPMRVFFAPPLGYALLSYIQLHEQNA